MAVNTTTDEAKATVEEEWIYAGVRLGKGNKKLHAWFMPDSTLGYFSKVAGSIVGHVYKVEVERDGDTVRVYGTGRYLAEQPTRSATDKQREEWRVEDIAAKQTLDGEQEEKRALKAGDELQDALDVLRRHRSRVRALGKQQMFDHWVQGELKRPISVKRTRDGEDY